MLNLSVMKGQLANADQLASRSLDRPQSLKFLVDINRRLGLRLDLTWAVRSSVTESDTALKKLLKNTGDF